MPFRPPFRPITLLGAFLAAATILACGGGSELGSVDSLLDVVPRGTDSFMSAQVEDLRDEGLDDLVDELADMVDADQLQDWEIDFDDITSLVISEPGGMDYLTLLRGFLSIEDIEEALDDDGFRDDTYQETDIWTKRRGDVALAFPAEDVLVIGAEKNVEKAIDTLKGDGRSLGNDEAVSHLIERYEDALVYTVIDDCYYRGCKMAGLGIMVYERDLIGMMVFDFRNEDAAFDAENDSEVLTAASVTDHWREVPAIRDIRIFDIPETAARVAMLETGEAQISGELPFRDVVRLQREGFKLQRGSGLAHERGVFFSGNYWETEHPITGRLLVRPREQKPWIGFIEDPASMESARLVRWAMSMSINREELKDALTGGLGEVCYLNQISTYQAGWKNKWEVPFDPEHARQLMVEAGYPDGFEAELWVGPGGFTAELGDAVARMWAEYLNISTIVDRGTYTRSRPSLVRRTNTQIYSSAGDEGKTGFPVHWPKGLQGSAVTDGGWGPGFEDPFYSGSSLRMNSEGVPDKRMRMAEAFLNYAHHQML